MTDTISQLTPLGTQYSVQGEGEPLVLIHGVGLDSTMWAGQLVSLCENYQVICYDMLGHGNSKMPEDNVTLKDYALQLKQLLDQLQIKKISLVGFSMGGLVARAFALHYPEYLSTLVIMNSVFNRTDAQRNAISQRVSEVAKLGPAANIEGALARWFSVEYRAASAAQVQHIYQKVIANDHRGYLLTYQLFASQDRYMADQLAKIKVPTLVLTGEFDSGSTPQMAEALAECIPGARALVLKDQRHMMPMESPKLVNTVLNDFLSLHDNRL